MYSSYWWRWMYLALNHAYNIIQLSKIMRYFSPNLLGSVGWKHWCFCLEFIAVRSWHLQWRSGTSEGHSSVFKSSDVFRWQGRNPAVSSLLVDQIWEWRITHLLTFRGGGGQYEVIGQHTTFSLKNVGPEVCVTSMTTCLSDENYVILIPIPLWLASYIIYIHTRIHT